MEHLNCLITLPTPLIAHLAATLVRLREDSLHLGNGLVAITTADHETLMAAMLALVSPVGEPAVSPVSEPAATTNVCFGTNEGTTL